MELLHLKMNISVESSEFNYDGSALIFLLLMEEQQEISILLTKVK